MILFPNTKSHSEALRLKASITILAGGTEFNPKHSVSSVLRLEWKGIHCKVVMRTLCELRKNYPHRTCPVHEKSEDKKLVIKMILWLPWIWFPVICQELLVERSYRVLCLFNIATVVTLTYTYTHHILGTYACLASCQAQRYRWEGTWGHFCGFLRWFVLQDHLLFPTNAQI